MVVSEYIGSVPSEEDYDSTRSFLECRVWRRQLIREFGKPPEGSRLAIVSNPHDFGPYPSVNLVFEESEAAYNYYFKCESESSGHWDAQSKSELGL